MICTKGFIKKLAICLVIVFVIAFIMIAAYAFIPSAKAGMDYYLGPTFQGIGTAVFNTWLGLTMSEGWLMYITPNIPWIFLGFGVLLTVLVLNPIKDSITGWFATRHKVPLPTSTGTVSTLSSGSSTPINATLRPSAQEPAPTPPVEPKKEETTA